jgi:hypothetical protein
VNGFGCLHDHICAIKNISLSVLCIVVSLKNTKFICIHYIPFAIISFSCLESRVHTLHM